MSQSLSLSIDVDGSSAAIPQPLSLLFTQHITGFIYMYTIHTEEGLSFVRGGEGGAGWLAG